MKAPLRRYLLRLALLTSLLYLSGCGVFCLFLREEYTPWLIPLPLIASLFYLISYSVQVRSATQSTGRFTRTSMVITMARLVFYIAMVLIFLLMLPGKGITLVLAWGILYLFYTSLEVSAISRYIRENQN